MNSADFDSYLRGCPVGTADRLLSIQEITQRWLPWADEQLAALCELAGVPDDSELRRDAAPWYLLLCAHYMLHDAAVDEPKTSVDTIVASADASALVWWAFEGDVVRHIPAAALHDVRARVVQYMAERNASLVVESERKRTWDLPTPADRLAAIGRNNAPLLALDVLGASTGRLFDRDVFDAVSQLLYLMQLGDDLGDWEDDYQMGNRTPFLRSVVHDVNSSDITSLTEMRALVHTTGHYERYVSRLICDFDQLRHSFAALEAVSSGRALTYIDAARDKALSLLRESIATKMSYLEEHDAI